MTRHPRPVPQRVAWYDGSALIHRDLADAVAHEERMLALHVAGLHDTWGVAAGLTASLGTDGQTVIVRSGLAYDCRGESLVLTTAVTAPAMPPDAMIADLVIAAPHADGCGCGCDRLIDCAGTTARPRPTLRWAQAAALADQWAVFGAPLAPNVRLGDEVPLARFTRIDGVIAGPDYSQRRVARALARPYIGHGTVAASTLAWQGTPEGDSFAAVIDTSAAGFSATPQYFASFTGLQVPSGFAGPFLSVERATATAFTLRVYIPLRSVPTAPGVVALLASTPATTLVTWTGLEETRGCPPSLSSAFASSLATSTIVEGVT